MHGKNIAISLFKKQAFESPANQYRMLSCYSTKVPYRRLVTIALSQNRTLTTKTHWRSQLSVQSVQQRYNSTFTGNNGRGAQIASTLGNTLIIGSVVSLFGYIMFILYDDLFADHGVTRIYNESLDLVRANPQIRELFGTSAVGFGQTTSSRRHRQRTITHRKSVDAQGRQRLFVEYYVTDSKRNSPCIGVVKADLSQSKGTGVWDYNYIIVDVHRPADIIKGMDSELQASDVGGESLWQTLHASKPIGRIQVLVTDEFAREIKLADSQRRNQKFSTVGKGTPDGSWFSVLHPSTWRK